MELNAKNAFSFPSQILFSEVNWERRRESNLFTYSSVFGDGLLDNCSIRFTLFSKAEMAKNACFFKGQEEEFSITKNNKSNISFMYSLSEELHPNSIQMDLNCFWTLSKRSEQPK